MTTSRPAASATSNQRLLGGKTALVSGSSGGIGFATAAALAEAGATVVITEVPQRSKEADAAASALRVHEAGAWSVPLDVTRRESIDSCIDYCVERCGGVDILVNNAGTNVRKPALDFTEADWHSVLSVNLTGAFFLAQAAARQMARAGGGKIVNVASIYGVVGGDSRIAYAASKAALVNITRCLALEWAPLNIQVNAVAPTFALTPLTDQLFATPEALEEVLGRTPAGRLAKVEEIAAAIKYLVSPSADIVTGVTLPVDGGWTAQ